MLLHLPSQRRTCCHLASYCEYTPSWTRPTVFTLQKIRDRQTENNRTDGHRTDALRLLLQTAGVKTELLRRNVCRSRSSHRERWSDTRPWPCRPCVGDLWFYRSAVFDPTSSSRQVVAELQADRRATTQRLAGRLLLLLLPLYYDVISTPNCPDVCHVIRHHHHHHHRDRRHRPPTSLSLSRCLSACVRVCKWGRRACRVFMHRNVRSSPQQLQQPRQCLVMQTLQFTAVDNGPYWHDIAPNCPAVRCHLNSTLFPGTRIRLRSG